MARNELADLYVTGCPFTLTQAGRAPVTLWLQKLNDLDKAKAVKKAGAAQARVLAVLRDTESEDYLSFVASAYEMPFADLVDRVLRDQQNRVLLAEQAKLEEAEEWSDDGYLEGLMASLRDGMMAAYVADPDDVDAKHVFDEVKRFNDQVAAAVEHELADERARLEACDIEDLQDQVIPLLVKEAGSGAWMNEYRHCEVWLGVRRCTHGEHPVNKPPIHHRECYFESRAEVDDLQSLTYLQLSVGMQNITVEAFEGKDLEETPASSSSSEQPEEPDRGVSSGLVGASA